MLGYIRRIVRGIIAFSSEMALKRSILSLSEATKKNPLKARHNVRNAYANCKKAGGRANQILIGDGEDVLKDVTSINPRTARFLLTSMLKGCENDWLNTSRCIVSGFKALPAMADVSSKEAHFSVRAMLNACNGLPDSKPVRTFVDSGLAALVPVHEKNFEAATELADTLDAVVKNNSATHDLAAVRGQEIFMSTVERHPEVAGSLFGILWHAAGGDTERQGHCVKLASDIVLSLSKRRGPCKVTAPVHILVRSMMKTVGQDSPWREELVEKVIVPVPENGGGYAAEIQKIILKASSGTAAFPQDTGEASGCLDQVSSLVAVDGFRAAGALHMAVRSSGLETNIFDDVVGKDETGNVIIVSSPKKLGGQIGFSVTRPYGASVKYVFGRFCGTGRELLNRQKVVHGEDAWQEKNYYYRFCQRTIEVMERSDEDIPDFKAALMKRLSLAMKNARRKQEALAPK